MKTSQLPWVMEMGVLCDSALSSSYCHVLKGVAIDGVWIGELTTYTHDTGLQAITARSLIYTLYKSPQHPLSLFPVCCILTGRSLTTAYNNGDYLHVLISCIHSLPYRTLSISLSRPGILVYRPGANPTENTAPNSSSVVTGGCLAIARIFLTS
jgi:hypothetical protein